MILIYEKIFINYIQKNDQKLWGKYKNLSIKFWGWFLYFIREVDVVESEKLAKIKKRILLMEKVAMVSLIGFILFFLLAIITSVMLQK